MPEPSKKYVTRDRSTKERQLIVNNLQNLMIHQEISDSTTGFNKLSQQYRTLSSGDMNPNLTVSVAPQ